MRKLLLLVSVLACMALSGCGADNTNQADSSSETIKGNVEIKDESGKTLITTDDISSVSSGIEDSEPYVELVLNDEGKDAFFKATSENMGKKLSIYVNNMCISEPIVYTAIKDGIVHITEFEYEEQALDIVTGIKEGQPENKIISELKKQQSSDNLVSGRIYSLYSGDNPFDFSFIVFYDDNTFRGIKPCWSYNDTTKKRTDWFETTSGTYDISKAGLTIKFSSEEYSGAVDGDKITFAKTVFSDNTDGNYSPEFCKSLQ